MRRRFSFIVILLITLMANLNAGPLTVVAQNCSNDAELIEQTVDPTSAVVAPDASFTAGWTLLNKGDCTWDRSYRLVFVSGERMDSPRTTRLRGDVEPGQSVTLSLELTAPSDVERYRGTWQMRTPDGENFGPRLTLEIEVAEGEGGGDQVVLPEVMVFGGMGAGDEDFLQFCVDNGALPEFPTLVVDDFGLEYRYVVVIICSLPEGTEITVEVTNPDGNTFSRSYIEDEAVTSGEEGETQYTGTVLPVNLAWIKQAPEGDWAVQVTGEGFSADTIITVPPLATGTFEEEYPQLDNWPVAPADPFDAAGGCHYSYIPGEEMVIGGENLPPDTILQLGFYQSRFGSGYLAVQETVQTDEEGIFTLPYNAPMELGSYNLVLLQGVDPQGFTDDGQYDFAYTPDSAFACFDVVPEEESDERLRLAFASGFEGQSDVYALDMESGIGYYLTSAFGLCDASEPAWWPGGEWVIYQSNCVDTVDKDGIPIKATGDNYDLYASLVDPTYQLPQEETLSRLTETADLDETEPDANGEGLIVYRQTAAGTPLDESGELWLLDLTDNSATPLGISGRAPAWSPDGTHIAYMTDIDGQWLVYVYDLEEETTWRVSDGCSTHCRLPAWSPDGKQILYHVSVSDEDFTPKGVWIASVTGVGLPRPWLTGEFGRPSWSAEGWIAVQGPGGIYRAKPGRQPNATRYLYSDPQVAVYWGPVWSR